MKLCLDTSIFIEVFRARRPQFRQRLLEAAAAGLEIQISALVLHELTYGARICSQPQRELALIEGIVAQWSVVAWSPEDAIAAAALRADLSARGSKIGALDSLLAGQALNQGWTVVTTNLNEFVRVDGLSLLDWSDPSGPKSIDREAWMLANLRRPLKETK